MYKALIYTDVHFSQNSSIVRRMGQKYSVRLENLISSLSWAEHLAEENNCDEVLCLGDFFDKPELGPMEITALQDVYFANCQHLFLVGNHESNIASLEYSSTNIFKSLDAKVISKPKSKVVNGVELYFIPYLTAQSALNLADYVGNNNCKKIVFSHNDLAGIQYGRFTSNLGFDVNSILDNCTLFINGHLHNSYMLNDRIVFVGNLTGQNFNEDASQYNHYAYILSIDDQANITLTPYINPVALNFYKLYITKRNDLVKLDQLKDNSVISVSCDSDLLNEVSTILQHNNKVVEYKLISLYKNYNKTELSDEFDFSKHDHIQQFIDFIKQRVDQSEILDNELSILRGNN